MNNLKFMECKRLNVSCKNCFSYGKCGKQIIQKPKIKWYNIIIYGSMSISSIFIWYYIVKFLINIFGG